MSEIEPLTDRQAAVLDFIRASVTDRGYPPSVREVADAVGLGWPSSAAYQLRVLAEKGYLRRAPGIQRGILLVEPEDRRCGTCGGTGAAPVVA